MEKKKKSNKRERLRRTRIRTEQRGKNLTEPKKRLRRILKMKNKSKKNET